MSNIPQVMGHLTNPDDFSIQKSKAAKAPPCPRRSCPALRLCRPRCVRCASAGTTAAPGPAPPRRPTEAGCLRGASRPGKDASQRRKDPWKNLGNLWYGSYRMVLICSNYWWYHTHIYYNIYIYMWYIYIYMCYIYIYISTPKIYSYIIMQIFPNMEWWF